VTLGWGAPFSPHTANPRSVAGAGGSISGTRTGAALANRYSLCSS